MSELENYLEFAKELAEEAGKIMLKYFRTESLKTDIKEDLSPVTMADTEVNSMVISRVKQKYPDYGVLGEEESFNLDSKQLWIVDPIDGTFNFSSGLAGSVFSVAFADDGVVKAGVIYDPLLKVLFWAAAGQGAYENNRKLDVSNNAPKGKLHISTWLAGNINGTIFKEAELEGESITAYNKYGDIFVSDWPVAHAIALVAAGRLDGSATSCKNPWDLAAGGIIAQEAGAKVTDVFGNPISIWNKNIKGMVAAPPKTHKILMEIIGPVVESATPQ
jgi:myo-inositol-1(or 4)-monophosphatase